MSEPIVLAGAGPGDARHVTTEVAEALRAADVVFAEASVGEGVLALATRAEHVLVTESESPVVVATKLVARQREGKAVVRLFAGDPLLLSRGDVEARELARLERVPRVLPGLSVLTAVAACAGVPLTRTEDASPSVAFARVTRAHEALHAWDKLAGAVDVLALFVDADVLADTARTLVFHGLAAYTPSIVVENAALSGQRTQSAPISEVARGALEVAAPTVVFVVGARVRPEPSLVGFTSRPLFGRRIVVTRADEQAGSLVTKLRELGADVTPVPTIAFGPPSDPSILAKALGDLARFSWILFTSQNGVRRFFEALLASGRDVRALGSARIAVIGSATARSLETFSLRADVVAKDARAEGLASALLPALAPDRHAILLARAEVGRDELPGALTAAGHDVTVVPVYRTEAPAGLVRGNLSEEVEHAAAVTFTSPSTATRFVEAIGAEQAAIASRTRVFASIGPVTTEALEALGLRVGVTAAEATEDALAEALCTALQR